MEREIENQKIYELGYLLLPTVSEETIGVEASKVISVIESNGYIVSSEMPEKRKLEYDISKVISNKKTTFGSGYFGFVIFQTEAGKLIDTKTELEKNENILRFILINRSKGSLAVEKGKVSAKRKGKGKVAVVSDKKVSGASGVSGVKSEDIKINEDELDKSIEELITN